MGEHAQANTLFIEALEGCRRVLGDEHQRTLVTLKNYSFALRSQGRYEESEPLGREAYETRKRVLGLAHEETLATAANLGSILLALDEPSGARDVLAPAADAAIATLTVTHPLTRALVTRTASAEEALHTLNPNGGHGERAAQWMNRRNGR